MKFYSLIIILSFGLFLGVFGEQCGKQAGGALCPNGLCCSEYGYCGDTDPYCQAGCQSQCRGVHGEQCGWQANGSLCPNGLCCSEFGWCGDTDPYCGPGCQSQCRGPGGVGGIITAAVFDQMLKHRNDPKCPSNGFYSYNAFITAANSFHGFGTTGDDATRRRELAAFFGQTSRQTTGGWEAAPDGPYAWGYCYIRSSDDQATYCTPNPQWPCAPGQKYYGRGPIQLAYNDNYGQAGRALQLNLLNNPDQVATNATISFKTAIWFWMTPQGNKPSSHDVIINKWKPTPVDIAAGRLPGYGVITNIITGGQECCGSDPGVSRIEFYKKYCDMLRVSYGDNLDCNNQRPFDNLDCNNQRSFA